MADWIVGYAPQPALSDDGTGNTRVTFGPWELDWEWFNLMAVGVDFVANTNTLTTALITAKGGAERTGYWFDLQLAFGTWAAGDRCSPQRGAVVNWRTTPALAYAAMANLDSALVWYSTTTGWSTHGVFNAAAGVKGIDVFGMLSRYRVTFNGGLYILNLSGNLAAINRQLVFRNISAIGSANYIRIVGWTDTAALPTGLGVMVDRCAALGLAELIITGNGVLRCCEVRNSFCIGNASVAAVNCNGNCGFIARFVTVLHGPGFTANGTASLMENCVAMWPSTAAAGVCYNGMAAATINNCLASDATGNPVLLDNRTDADAAWWFDNDYGNNCMDPFIMSTSFFRGQGVAIPGLTWDILGEPRANPPSLGCHEGLEVKAVQNYLAPIPAGFAAADAGTGTEIIFTWTNGADYLAADEIIIYNNAGNPIGKALASLGTVRLGGFPNGVAMANMYATAVSDNGVESAASALATATPTGANTCAGILHLRCDAAVDEEAVDRYLWFISPDQPTALARRILAQAQIDARVEITGYDLATPTREAEIDGLVAGSWYWCFVVAVDVDGLGSQTAAGDMGQFQADDGMAAVGTGAKQRIIAVEGLGVRVDG